MQHLQTALKLASLLALTLLLIPANATGQWSNSRGGPERDGARTGSAELPIPQVKWRQALGGDLGISSIWQIPDPLVPRIALTVGGRVSLKRWDDSLSWQGQLFGLSKFIAASDIDDDGVTDLLFASGGSVESTVVGYTPDGEAAFTADPGILGPITTGTRVVDLDGDGFRDLYITSFRAGPSGAIAAAFRFPNGNATEGELMYTIDGGERDYVGGFYDVIAEIDGTPGLEILALGHSNIYLYDAATGALESTTEISGFVPYARATLRAVDIDNDGVSEVFAFSNQAWSQKNNRRHATLFGYRGGEMTELWDRDLGNDPGARLEFTDSSVVNLDGTGPLEVVFSVRDADENWTTEIRDAASGTLLDSIVGERLEDIAITSRDTVLFTHDDGRPLRSYRFSRASGLSALALHPDVKLMRCRQDRPTNAEALRHVPCTLPVSGEPRRGVVAGEYDPITNRITALISLDMGGSLSEVARFDARGGVISAVLEILPGHAAVIAVAHSDGQLLPLDEKLRFLQPSPKPPFSWAGIRYGSRFAAFDLPGFPLVVPNSNGERIAALSGAGRATVLDATGDPSVVAGVETVWSEGSGSTLVVGGASDDPTVVLVNRTANITAFSAVDGTQKWLASDVFSGERPLHSDPLIVTDESVSPAQSRLWFHRRNSSTGIYDLTALDLSDGSVAISDPNLDTNDGGWKRLALATWDGAPAPISGRLGELWRFDIDGNVADVQTSTSASFVVPVPRVGENPLIIVDGRKDLSVFDPTTSTTLWSMPRVNTLGPRRGAIINVAGRPHFATADSSSPIFRSVDVQSGVIDFDYNLVAGELRDPMDPLPTPAPLLGNVTAITDLTGAGDPAFLVGSTDGFIYAIHALTGDLIWALFVGAQVGEIVPADWDGDGQLELVASTGDGTLLGIDRFSGDGPAWVNDTNGASINDIDELQTEDTLHAAWAPVEGATSYEVAVFTNDNQPITAGFADAGSQTQMTLRGLPLEAGVRYQVSVRAVSSAGVSPDRPSDGVTIIPAPEESQGGCCQVGGSPLEGGLQTLVLGGLCVLLTWRRKRRL